MDYKDREGNIVFDESLQDHVLKTMYSTFIGKITMRILTLPPITKLTGLILNSKPSCLLIEPFIKLNKIDMSEYENKKYRSYNDFMTRKIKPTSRPFNLEKDVLISPCDGRVYAVDISENSVFIIKSGKYSIHSLLKDKKLSDIFIGGTCLIFRLSVENNHRYCYVDNLRKSKNRKIEGVFNRLSSNVYKENPREYSLMYTENFGRVIQIEIGALHTGKINNYHGKGSFKKGQEKGLFEFAGPCIVLLFEKDKVIIDQDILDNTEECFETYVKMGEKIGVSIKG